MLVSPLPPAAHGRKWQVLEVIRRLLYATPMYALLVLFSHDWYVFTVEYWWRKEHDVPLFTFLLALLFNVNFVLLVTSYLRCAFTSRYMLHW
jgi:hypothetical protein